MPMILQGCKLARELEVSLNDPDMAGKKALLLDSCVEIVNTFSKAISQLDPEHPFASFHLLRAWKKPSELLHGRTSAAMVDDLLIGSSSRQQPLMDLLPQQSMVPVEIDASVSSRRSRKRWVLLLITQISITCPCYAILYFVIKKILMYPMFFIISHFICKAFVHDVLVAFLENRKSCCDFIRRTCWKWCRNDGKEKVSYRVPAQGNSEVPPDAYIWRKYGQKEILGSKFPRYYLCQFMPEFAVVITLILTVINHTTSSGFHPGHSSCPVTLHTAHMEIVILGRYL